MKMKTVPLADVLWTAANVHLPPDDTCSIDVWSCNAALHAERGAIPIDKNMCVVRKGSATDGFLKSLGCPTGGQVGQFLSFREGKPRQGVRYLWLLLAACVAADEGINIKVPE